MTLIPTRQCRTVKAFWSEHDAEHDAELRGRCYIVAHPWIDGLLLTVPVEHWPNLHGPDGGRIGRIIYPPTIWTAPIPAPYAPARP